MIANEYPAEILNAKFKDIKTELAGEEERRCSMKSLEATFQDLIGLEPEVRSILDQLATGPSNS